jgi:multisubunit Na+/H+ antiporter MnhC subunit
MTIWLVAVVLVGLFTLIGYFQGAIRGIILVVGAVAALLLARPVGGLLEGLVPLFGLKNPVWPPFVAPVIAFVLLSVVVAGLAALAHFLIARAIKNKSDDYAFARWDRLNRRTGLALGAALGALYVVALGVVVYVPGYLVTQVVADEAPAPLRAVRTLRQDMEDTGLARLAARFDPAPQAYYDASDIIGVVYHNPPVQARLASYPPFLGLAERPEFQELAADPEVNTLIQSGAPIGQILENPRVAAIVNSDEIVNALLALDLGDLKQYLLTGESPLYRDEHLLGRWRLNVRRSIAEMKAAGDKLPGAEFNLIRKAMTLYLADLTIGFTTDNRALLKVQAKDAARLQQTIAPAAAPAAATPAPAPGGGLTARALAGRAVPPEAQGGMSPELRARYGLGGAGQPVPAAPETPPAPVMVRQAARAPTTALTPIMSSGEGTWARDGDDYALKFGGEGAPLALRARVKDGQLFAEHEGRVLVFDRI